jgi:hypothetical protein
VLSSPLKKEFVLTDVLVILEVKTKVLPCLCPPRNLSAIFDSPIPCPHLSTSIQSWTSTYHLLIRPGKPTGIRTAGPGGSGKEFGHPAEVNEEVLKDLSRGDMRRHVF